MTLTRYSYTIGKNHQNFYSYMYVFSQYGIQNSCEIWWYESVVWGMGDY